ncbi:MAG: RecQ family ATP-dependent DNA helicase, partial [Candidatus Spyradocola sp.]
ILYVAPERLETAEFRAVCGRLRIPLVAVDEAHCVSQWGQDFRPSYLRIREFIDGLAARPVVGAFTATATEQVRQDIAALLGLRTPYRVTTGFDRPNLRFEVRAPKDKKQELLGLMQRFRERCGIVYCSTRKGVEEVCDVLSAHGYAATRYHAGLSDEERRRNQDDFLYDRATVMAATNAFGMGIDKSNVGFVIHYNMPKNLEGYYQEAGRAGRDGSPADCILLYAPQDVRTNQYLIEHESDNPELSAEQAAAVRENQRRALRRMAEYCTTSECLRATILRYFGEDAAGECCNCSNCEGEFDVVDVTNEAHSILECVSELRQRYGKTVILDVLRGSRGERIRRLRLENTGCYGTLRGVEEERLRAVMDELLRTGVLTADDGEYPVLRMGQCAGAVLYEGARVTMKVRRHQAKRADEKLPDMPAKKRSNAQISDDDPLFAALKALRRRLADEKHQPAFVIFTDATLRDMCAKRPGTRQEMLAVSGVGEHKMALYGKVFLEEIGKYR